MLETECPNCNAKYKAGMFATVEPLPQNLINIINEYHAPKSESYCTKCGKELYELSKIKLDAEQRELSGKIKIVIEAMPVISLHNPINWDYEVNGMVTGQSTTGTGIISEFSASFTDLFGMQSSRYNKKIKDGESLCFTQIRKNALDIGANAVIATDIDYSEVGGEKGMLLVCMAGTAVNLKNLSVLGDNKAAQITDLQRNYKRLMHLNSFQPSN